MGRVFLHSAQKNFGGQSWSKAGPSSFIPHLGLCRLNHPHEPGSGPEQEVDLNKKKKVVNTSIYPDEIIERLARCFYPAILECFNSEEGQQAFAAWQAEQARATAKEKQDVPAGERPVLHSNCQRLFSDEAHLSGCAFLFGLQCNLSPPGPPGLLVRPRAGDSAVIQLPEENEKSEPFSYRKKVRILFLWCG